MYRDILVPTDGSDGTRRAIMHALDLADTFGGTVHALAVLNEGPYDGLASDAALGGAERKANRAVDRVRTEAERRGITATTTVRRGAPAAEILEYADELDADGIVMGTHGRTGLDRLIVGSVTERVVREADIPVVTVRMGEEIAISDAARAEEISLEVMADEGHENPRILEEPYRTSASWVVPFESESGSGHVHVDAVTGDARIGTVDRDR